MTHMVSRKTWILMKPHKNVWQLAKWNIMHSRPVERGSAISGLALDKRVWRLVSRDQGDVEQIVCCVL